MAGYAGGGNDRTDSVQRPIACRSSLDCRLFKQLAVALTGHPTCPRKVNFPAAACPLRSVLRVTVEHDACHLRPFRTLGSGIQQPQIVRWPPKLGQELAGVKIESRRLMMPGYAARSLVSDGITSPSSMESFSVCDCGACGYVCNVLALCTYPRAVLAAKISRGVR